MARPRNVSIFAACLLSAAAVAGMLLVLALAAVLKAMPWGLAFADAMARVTSDPLNLAVAQGAAFAAVVYAGLRRYGPDRPWMSVFGRTQIAPAAVLLSFVAGTALQFPLAELGNFAQMVFPIPVAEQLLRQRMVTPTGLGSALAILFAVVVVAPVSEELLFRGLLLPGLAERHGRVIGILISALLFGIIHFDPVAIIYATTAGIVLGALALRTGSTLVAIALHAGVNAVPILLPERLLRIEGFNTIGERVYHLPLPLVCGASAIAIVALVLSVRMSGAATDD